jgi:hypothetical protein
VAQKVQVVLTCDLDEQDTPAVETVTFSYDGATYEFELCQRHRQEFHDVMQRYVVGARQRGGRARRPTRSRAGGQQSPGELAAVRQWARANGYEVSDRGRISAAVRQAYEAAHR